MLKVSNIIHALPKDADIHVMSADAVELLIGTVGDIAFDESNLTDWALSNNVVRYEYFNDLHVVYTDGRFEDLPSVKNLLAIISGVKTIGVHFDDNNEIYTPKELINDYGDKTVTSVHICEKDMCGHFNIELWLA